MTSLQFCKATGKINLTQGSLKNVFNVQLPSNKEYFAITALNLNKDNQGEKANDTSSHNISYPNPILSSKAIELFEKVETEIFRTAKADKVGKQDIEFNEYG